MTSNLFEYQNRVDYEGETDRLEVFLDEVWRQREVNSFYSANDDRSGENQQFLQVLRQSGQLRSRKYVGVINFEGEKINLLPKIFYDEGKEYSQSEVSQMYNHILWWLSYCRKIRFPNYQSASGSVQSDFFETLIYLFAKYTRELLSSSVYQQYEEVHRELSFIKGRLNVQSYLTQNLNRGRWHKLNCTFDSFEIDNQFNRIIKSVATMLFRATASQDNKKHLREILFLLDEVSDVSVTAEQCRAISFNPMFGQFETVRDYCELFLSNSVSVNYQNELKLFAFLLPMEYVFEDFLFGFIDRELPNVLARSQRGDTYLDKDRIFNLRPDLWIKTANKSLIADAKYKIVYGDPNDPKNGIAQSDLYQMLAYAVRFNLDEILLFYPEMLNSQQQGRTELVIEDALAGGKEIRIFAYQLPIINRELFREPTSEASNLQVLFENTRSGLKTSLEKILGEK